jgi:hypothetical protein
MNRNIIITAAVLAALVLGVSGLIWWKYKDGMPTNNAVATVNDEDTVSITAKHQFKDGTHIVAGDVNLPTPCYVLNTEARVAESQPEQVTLVFTTQTEPNVCAQVVTTERFKIDFKADENATITATWNGKPAKLNLIPAGADEDLSNFELFIKG